MDHVSQPLDQMRLQILPYTTAHGIISSLSRLESHAFSPPPPPLSLQSLPQPLPSLYH